MAANAAIYSDVESNKYIDGAPHLKHASVRSLYSELVKDVYSHACQLTHAPRVLDLGSGEGSATLPFLELGAHVTAVDLSEGQLRRLSGTCARYRDRLEVRQQEITPEGLLAYGHFDIVVMNSFLHNVPDYLGLVAAAVKLLQVGGQLLSFQDPMRYDTLGRFTYWFSTLAYMSWRVFQGDLVGGYKRRRRRSRGVYLADCEFDNAEYHVTRNGVDQNAIVRLLSANGLECRLVKYFSTEASLFQPLGAVLGLANEFAIIARSTRLVPAIDADGVVGSMLET